MKNLNTISERININREKYEQKEPEMQKIRYEKLQTKMKNEFFKISQQNEFNESIDEITKVNIYFKNEKYLKTSTYPNNSIKQFMDNNIDEFLKNEYRDYYDDYKNGKALAQFLDRKLNQFACRDSVYWCFYLCTYGQSLHSIKHDLYYELVVIKINKKRLEDNFKFEGEIHPFIEKLKFKLINHCSDRNYDEIYRRVITDMDNFLYYNFNDFNLISSLRYEGKMNNGMIMYSNVKKDYKDIWNISIELEDNIKLNEYKKIRKLLEISSSENTLLLNEEFEAFAFGTIKEGIDYYRVNFIEDFTWKVVKNNNDYIGISKLQPVLPSKGNGDKKIEQKLIDVFNDKNMQPLLEIIKNVKKQKKGTILVISENALEEAARLKACGIKISQKQLNDANIIRLITSIDGAVLVDIKGICHAIGVILDGSAIKEGDSSRGARYNSAWRYFNLQKKKNKKCMLVVVSEDGYVDIISEKTEDSFMKNRT